MSWYLIYVARLGQKPSQYIMWNIKIWYCAEIRASEEIYVALQLRWTPFRNLRQLLCKIYSYSHGKRLFFRMCFILRNSCDEKCFGKLFEKCCTSGGASLAYDLNDIDIEIIHAKNKHSLTADRREALSLWWWSLPTVGWSSTKTRKYFD